MENTQDFFEIEYNFSRYSRYIAAAMFIYYILIMIFGRYARTSEIYTGILLIMCILLDGYIGHKHYWKRKVIFRISKQLILFSASFAMISNGGIYLTIALATFVYLNTAFQYYFVFDIVEEFYRINALIETTFSLAFISLMYYIFRGHSNFEIFLVMGFVVAIETILIVNLKVSSGLINKVLNNMYRQERIAINSREEYENLKVYQSKLVNANEQLSIQKFELQQLNENINSRNQQMDLQYRILKHISSALDIDKLMEFITSGIIDNIKIDLCILYVFETVATEEIKEKFYNIKYSKDSHINSRAMDLFVDYVQNDNIEEFLGEYIVNNDVEPGRYEFLKKSNILSLLIYPIDISPTQKCILAVGKNTPGYFTQSNIDFFKSIGEQIIVAVNNASMYLKMQDMATKDPLTRIFNRRHFNTIYPQYVDKAKQKNQPLTIILFDIDKFKNVNDQYGHLFGDKVIRFCGSLAGKTARRNGGIAVRYGGEEFVIVFPNKGVETVERIVSDMHEQLKEYGFDYEETKVYVNVSIGISSYPETCDDFEELLNRADLAMYHSKNTGRGRISVDSPKIRGEE